jgi:uncharacterized protein YjbJ (UPF0337 family)
MLKAKTVESRPRRPRGNRWIPDGVHDQIARGKRQEARGKRQEARGKRQEARGKRQEARGKRLTAAAARKQMDFPMVYTIRHCVTVVLK